MKATDKKSWGGAAFIDCICVVLLLLFFASADKFQMGILVSFSQLPFCAVRKDFLCIVLRANFSGHGKLQLV